MLCPWQVWGLSAEVLLRLLETMMHHGIRCLLLGAKKTGPPSNWPGRDMFVGPFQRREMVSGLLI